MALAARAGLSALALTDHDTFDGLPEALEAGRGLGLRVVPGVELSLPHETGSFHLIVLGGDPTCPELRDVADRLRDARGPRNAAMLARLNELGIAIAPEELVQEAGGPGEIVARPHMARVLVRKGVVRDFQDAFDRYLGRGAAAYVERQRVSFAETARAARLAGGATVLCHPFTLGYRTPGTPDERAALRAFLVEHVAQGLDAIEVRYGTYDRRQERFWEALADDVGLLPSGGSDFHGAMKPGLRVGRGRGRMRVPEAWLDALLARGEERRTA